MTTVLISRPRDGKTKRRCDARCYDAKGKKCTCICGGKNHGVGFEKALENSFDLRLFNPPLDDDLQFIRVQFQTRFFRRTTF